MARVNGSTLAKYIGKSAGSRGPFIVTDQLNGGLNMADAGIITSFITAAMKQTNCEKLDDGTFYYEISSCPGVWVTGDTVEECITDLRESLELWLVLKLKDKDPLPVFGDIDLNKIGIEIYEADEY